MSSASARIVNSTRNGQILEAGGFRYQKRSSNRNKSRTYWRCILREECNGTVISNYNTHAGIVLKRGLKHTYEPDDVEIEVQEVIRSMKRRAIEQPNAPPASIFRDEIARVQDNEVVSNMPQRNDVIRTLNRVQNRTRPNNPQSLADFVIMPLYTLTLNGERFMQFDSRIDGNDFDSEDSDRFIMFYTRWSLEKLCASRIIISDGTFKTVPHLFYQLYFIHGVVRELERLEQTLLLCSSSFRKTMFFQF